MLVYRYFPDVDNFDAVVAKGKAEKSLRLCWHGPK
jgi:hypothetical protein